MCRHSQSNSVQQFPIIRGIIYSFTKYFFLDVTLQQCFRHKKGFFFHGCTAIMTNEEEAKLVQLKHILKTNNANFVSIYSFMFSYTL